MPRRFRRTRKRNGRKPYIRRRKPRTYGLRKRRFGRNVLTRSVNPAVQMPHIWRLRYNTHIQLSTLEEGGFNTATFVANGLFNPENGATGEHQPMLFDQLSTFWNSYCVLGSKMRIKILPSTAPAAFTTQYIGVVLDDDEKFSPSGSTSQTIENFCENAKGKYRIVNNNSYTTARSMQLSCCFSSRKFFGKKYPQDAAAVAASFTANPQNLAYFIIWTADPFAAADQQPSKLSLDITIDYIVQLREPKDIGQSTV